VADLTLKNRHPISEDDIREANDRVDDHLGIRPLPEDDDSLVEKARAGPYELLLHEGNVLVVLEGSDVDEATPTLRALLQHRPAEGRVTVDMGAVPHLRNGADVMSPGITDADDAIQDGDLVWVVDIEHEQPLGIGHALVDGPEMVDASSGKAISIWHHVGDEIWSIGE
jgi:PUA domain protein